MTTQALVDRVGKSRPAVPFDLQAFVARYVAMWNEPGELARLDLVQAVWAPDGVNFTRSMEVRGHEFLLLSEDGRIREDYQFILS
ncbi:MAG TPA: hypothetical protein VN667_22125 [Burkholderiales bacterium]|nr:hypothetical protein [Burkholderiales bacterium]